jgi:hypothetical protein
MPLEHRGEPDRDLETALKSGRIDAAIIALPFAPPASSPSSCTRSRSRSSCRRAQVGDAQVDPRRELAAEHTILLNVGHCFRDQVLEAVPS